MHTARGTCQVCGRIQAYTASGIVAKHGYQVAGYGFFAGVCPGAKHHPAEKSLTVTFGIIAQLEEDAVAHDIEAADYRTGALVITHYEAWDATMKVTKRSRHGTYQTTGGYRLIAITPETPIDIIDREYAKVIAVAEQNARYARAHVQMMREFIVPRLGRDLYPAAEVIKAERKIAKAKAVEGVRFPTKQSRKDALDKLNRLYDRAREELQGFYLQLPDSERTKAKSEIYFGPMQLNHWKPKHSMQALNEFPEAAEIIDRIENLVTQREEIKNAK